MIKEREICMLGHKHNNTLRNNTVVPFAKQFRRGVDSVEFVALGVKHLFKKCNDMLECSGKSIDLLGQMNINNRRSVRPSAEA